LVEAGMDPTCFLGGELVPLGGNLRVGGPLTVVEACEAYNSFLDLTPEAAIVTNIEVDHLHFHGTPEHLFESFRQFLRQVQALAVLNGDDPLLSEMRQIPPRSVTYGLGAGNEYRAAEVRLGATPTFTLLHGTERLGDITLQVPGVHNVSDATGAAALALELGADFSAIQRALAAFPGMHRRFERIGMCGEIAVVDDYAHHPTEIRATLAAAREAFPGRIVAIFQPHLFSRTRDLLEEFSQAFAQADAVCIAPIYPAREAPIPGVDHRQLAERIAARQPETPVLALNALQDAVHILAHAAGVADAPAQPDIMPRLHNGDVIITVGAGDVDVLARALVHFTSTHATEAER
ncbi:MAG TPA: cyanophycin synthetase, partial [Armatimonadota bacterium]